MRYKPSFGRGADKEMDERELVLTKSSGLFSSKLWPESLMPQGALLDCGDILPGTFRVRPGSGSESSANTYWNPNIGGTPTISGMFSFRRHSGTSELIASANGGVYKYASATTTTTLETGLTNNNFEFATMNDVLYYVNGDNGLRQYDGATAAAVTAKTAAASETANYLSDAGNAIHDSRYISVHDKVLYLASPLSNPYRLYRSDELVGPTYFHNYIDIISERGGEIRWITTFAGKLIVLKSDSIWAVDGLIGDGTIGVRRLHNQIGCAVGRTVQEVPGLGLVFMGSDRHFYVLRHDYVNGENVPLFRLSSHISDLIDRFNSTTPAFTSGVVRTYYVCTVNFGTGSGTARIVAFDFSRVESLPNDPTALFVPWSVYNEAKFVTFVRHIATGAEILIGSVANLVYYFEHPNGKATSSSPFYELNTIDFEHPHRRKLLNTMHIVTDYSGDNITPSISVDDADLESLTAISTTYTGAGAVERPGLIYATGASNIMNRLNSFKTSIRKAGYRFRLRITFGTYYQRDIQELRLRYEIEEVR